MFKNKKKMENHIMIKKNVIFSVGVKLSERILSLYDDEWFYK
jgi:hypothetical protein